MRVRPLNGQRFVIATPSLCSQFLAVCAVTGSLRGSAYEPRAQCALSGEGTKPKLLERQLLVWGVPALEDTAKVHLIYAPDTGLLEPYHLTHS